MNQIKQLKTHRVGYHSSKDIEAGPETFNDKKQLQIFTKCKCRIGVNDVRIENCGQCCIKQKLLSKTSKTTKL